MATQNKQIPDKIKLYVDDLRGTAKALEQDDIISKYFNIDYIEKSLILIYPHISPVVRIFYLYLLSCYIIVFIYYRLTTSNDLFHTVNKVLLFLSNVLYIKNGSRVMM